MKFASSPTPPVDVPLIKNLTRIFTSSIITPATGPILYVPTSTGTSEKSNSQKDGAINGSGNSINISPAAKAASIEITASCVVWFMPLFCFTIVIYNDLPINNITVSRHIIRKPHNKNCGAKSILTTRTKGTQKKFILFHPDYNRRYWSFTNSTIMARGLYHRWGITPRPEDNYSV